MLQVKNLTIYHKKDLRPLVSDLSFTLNDGDRAAVIGEEGNGKSTLLKLLYDPILVEDYAEYHGEILKNHTVCGYLPQELSVMDRQKDIYTFLSEEPAFLETDYRELASMAGKLGICTDLLYSDSRMAQLSGGEKIKIQLIRIMVMHPDLFLLDEPSNDIDIETLEWLEAFINECPFPVLYISHDETLLEHTANMILHMEQLKRKTQSQCTVFRTGYQEYVELRQKSIDRQTRLAQEEKAAYEKQQEKFRKIHDKVEHQQAVISRQNPGGARLLKKKMHAVKSMERRFEKQAENMTRRPDTEEAIFFRFARGEGIPAGKWVIDYDLPLLTAGRRELAHDIRIQVKGSEKICIIGKNGAGKTTLLRLIAGQLLERTDIRAAYMPQNYEELLDLDKTPVAYLSQTWEWQLPEHGAASPETSPEPYAAAVYDATAPEKADPHSPAPYAAFVSNPQLAYNPMPRQGRPRALTKEELTKIRTYLGSMKYTVQEMDHAIRDLSGGQKAKLLLLKMSMEHRNVLILDEPTRNFSPLSGPVVRALLQDFPGAIISVSHDRKYIREVCDRVLELGRDGLIPVPEAAL